MKDAMTDHKAEWVLVPRVATWAMLRAADHPSVLGNLPAEWAAMLAAAPAAPAASEGEDGAVAWRFLDEDGKPTSKWAEMSSTPMHYWQNTLREGPYPGTSIQYAYARPAAQVAATPKHDEGRELACALDKSARERAMAWDAVVALLNELSPHWIDHPGTGIDAALNTIRALATQPAARRVTDERPNSCRNRLHDEGKPHPRSGCHACKTGGMTGCPYERGKSFAQPAEGVSRKKHDGPCWRNSHADCGC